MALVWNYPVLEAFFRSPNAGVGRDLARRAINVETQAKINASGRPGPNVQTGRLRASITWALGEDAISMYARIGTDVEYAAYVERGHPNTAHVYPKRGGGFGYVSDRPTQAYPFLSTALPAAAL
jgi:phage gpG-like protein